MPDRMELQLNLPSSAGRPTRRDPAAPLRILVMADFSGRGHREEAPADLIDISDRRLWTVDVDNLDAIMARIAPKLRLPLDPAGDGVINIGFAQLDDFHPDALYQRLELFQALRRTRARLLNPASFAQAVAELAPPPLAEPVQTEPPTTNGDEADLLGRLLGKAPTPTATPVRLSDPGAAAVQNLLQAVIRPHIVHTDARQPAWIAALDAAIGEQLRTILHQPGFQALEAAWRSMHNLVNAIDSELVQVSLLDITRQELLADLRTAGGAPKATGLYTLLIDRGVRMHDGQPWSLLVGDYRFGTGAEDIALLAHLGSLAAHAGGPFLAAAEPSVLGGDATTTWADPARWSPLAAADQQRWQLLRRSAVAPWLGLSLPRVLLRLPYGQKTDPLDQIAFEEMPGGRAPEGYLWGNPAFVCARLLAAAFMDSGWDFSPDDVLELDDLPAHVYEEAGERVLQPVAEVLLGERAAQAILAQGLMPLLSHRQRNAVRLARFQSLAEPATALAGPWR